MRPLSPVSLACCGFAVHRHFSIDFLLAQVNEAALLAAKRGADHVTADMIDYAYDKVRMKVLTARGGCRCGTMQLLYTAAVDVYLPTTLVR
jgi:hypothetical protein